MCALCWLLNISIFEAGLRADLYNLTLEYEEEYCNFPFFAFLASSFVLVFHFSPCIPLIPLYEYHLLSHFPCVLFVISQLYTVSVLSCYLPCVNLHNFCCLTFCCISRLLKNNNKKKKKKRKKSWRKQTDKQGNQKNFGCSLILLLLLQQIIKFQNSECSNKIPARPSGKCRLEVRQSYRS